MKTNFLMLKDLLKIYHPTARGIVTYVEGELIRNALHLNEMDILALRNLRDFVVAHMSRYDDMENWDRMSAITYIIDTQIASIGGEV